MSGPLEGLKVVELSHPMIAWAGKLLADMGADVAVIEPPEGSALRKVEPFLADEPGDERSLSWWHYNTSKRSVTLDLESAEGRATFLAMAAKVDIVLESETPRTLAAKGIDYPDVQGNPGLIWVSVTPFGRDAPRNMDPATDLTLLASGGMAWMCGYDDHSLPPVRGGGNQGYHTGCHYGVMSALTALLYRDVSGEGQFIDVNTNAACNVTTEAGSYTWLVAQQTVQRQTGRHAGVTMSFPSQMQCADGRYINSGLPPRRGQQFMATIEWLKELKLDEEFPLTPMLEHGAKEDIIDLARIATDPLIREVFQAGRDAMMFIASKLGAKDFFDQAQSRGFQVGVIYAPEDVFSDEHFIARGFPTPVEHEDLGRTFTYPGAPYQFRGSPWAISRRAPHVGEHTSEVLSEWGVG